jgi:hypothetical protein
MLMLVAILTAFEVDIDISDAITTKTVWAKAQSELKRFWGTATL